MNKLPSHRNCKVCKTRFKPETVYQWWCDEEHEKEYITKLALKARRDRIQKDEQRRKKETQAERQSLKVRKLELKPDSHFKKLAQQAFNEYIRTRDRDQPCISCGETNPPDLHGGQWDCGHFKTVGGFPELRFVECNAYRQCKPCNAGSAKYGGKAATVEKMYRESLAEKFGQELVDWLDGPHEMTNYRRDDYIRIREAYKAKTKALKKLQEAA
ncbi:recombination protein NinG [Yersinia mollaretii]|uniref:recombination protein NinG n=1 Tax=Yersinia mollaretii TaxID=33060 RepID=UPI0015D4C02A|nr:recombination protein NinG [Yersinia mollaretii]MDA5529083.1 recombination protein NinG [Yersinia mollaretii]MDR7875757.1 recombination protein NinG [Yersinia mollaretii]WQC77058.1 recombination protein NinG [Yersinia mollaretii]HDM8093497.1 recombination protein NinG [Yersinia enterocolitica]